MGINMEMCLATLIVLLACLGFLFLCFKTVDFIIFLEKAFQEINSLRTDLKFLDERYTETRREIDALKKVNDGP
jgi:hypothetical protein